MEKVFITGASRGIGFAMATEFAKAGYKVYALWHNAKEKLADISNLDITLVQGDVSSFDSMKKVYEDIGDVDILINNAAISHFGLLTDLSEDEWSNIIDVNLKSVFITSKIFLP